MLRKNTTPGKLIVVEGIDGSGKSTQIDLLHKWLQKQGHSVYFSEWNSSDLVKSTTKLAKKRRYFTPTTFSLLLCTDFADRWENQILPLLKAGAIVLADRYTYTAFGRDVARGVDREWVRNLYSFAMLPDITLFFRVPLKIAIQRINSSRKKIKYYEAGMDLDLADSRIENFKAFQKRILSEYEKMVDEFDFTVVDGALSVQVQQRLVRKIVKQELEGWEGLAIPDHNPQSINLNGSDQGKGGVS